VHIIDIHSIVHIRPVYMKSRLLSSQSGQFEKYSKSSDWPEKSRSSKKATFVLIMQTC